MIRNYTARFIAVLLIVMSVVTTACQNDALVENRNIRLAVERIEVAPEGGQVLLNYAIDNPTEGEELLVETDAEWITSVEVYPSIVEFQVEINDSGQNRSTAIVLKYGSSRMSLTMTQEAWQSPITITVDEVEATAIVFSVTTLDPSTTWVSQIVDGEWFDSYTQEEIYSEDLRYFRSEADQLGIDVTEYIPRILNTGSVSNLRAPGLVPESEYVIYIYGMSQGGEPTTDIFYKKFTTPEPYAGNDVTFDFDIKCERAVATITVTPSHEGVPYYQNVATREDFEANGSDINALVDAIIAKVIDDYLYWEYAFEEIYEYNTEYLSTTYDVECTANTEYVVFAFKWNEELERLSEVSYDWFTIGDIPPSDNQLQMELSNVTQSTFDIVTTTTNDDPYIVIAEPVENIAKLRTDAAIYSYLLDNYGTWGLSYYICNGDVEGTFSGLEPSTEYAVLMFGYEAGVRTTSMVREDITTLASEGIDACTYTIDITEVGDREAHVSITPSDYSIWYYWNVFRADATEEEIVEYIENDIENYYYGDYWEFSYYELAQGPQQSYISHLVPSTDYKIVIVPMHPDYYLITGAMREGGEFTTSEAIVANNSIVASFKEYYDGDEAYALAPDFTTSYKGYSIIPMDVTVTGDCDNYLYTIFNYVEGLDDATVYSDDYLIENLYNVGIGWAPANFRGVWDEPMMIAAVAFDSAGNAGPVYRYKFTCTRDGAADVTPWLEDFLGHELSAAPMSESVVIAPAVCDTEVAKPRADANRGQSREQRTEIAFERDSR